MLRFWLKPILRALCRILFRVRVRGDFSALTAQRLLIVANHQSFLDGLLLGLFLPVNPVFVINTGITRSPGFRLLLSQIDYLAVDPTSPMAIKKIIKLVESGRPVAIFPEGRITITGGLMKVYDGPGFIAAKTGAAILPVSLEGPSFSYFSRMGGRYPKTLFPRVTLTLQPLTHIAMPEAPRAKDRRRLAGDAMRRLMQEMLFRSRPPKTLFGALLDARSAYGKRTPVVEDIKQVEYSYNDMLKMTLALGRLGERGTAPGERLGLLLPNLASTVAMTIGISARGRVPALLNFTAGAEGLASACRAACISQIYTARLFIENAHLEETVATLTAQHGVRVHYLEDLRADFSLADKAWLLWHMLFPESALLANDPEGAGAVLFTSGSEGKPKGVVLSHRALLSNIAQVRAVIDISTEDKILNALPVFHSFGLTGGALLPLFSGARLFLYPSPLHYRVIPEIAYDRNCTVLFGTGTFLGQYAKAAHPYDFHKLRYVIAGAEKLPEAVRAAWAEKFGIRVLEGYGATETAPVLAVNTPMANRNGTVGQLLPGIAHRIITVPGIERGGLLHVNGPNLMSGYLYYDHPGELQPPSSEAGPGWYSTGDVVEIDAEGFVHILGRVKRFAKIAGEMVSLEVVEQIAAAASPAAPSAASSQADAQRGEAIVLFTTDAALTRERLLEAARAGGYPELAVPRKIVHLETLPVLGTGKTDYVSLKQLAATL